VYLLSVPKQKPYFSAILLPLGAPWPTVFLLPSGAPEPFYRLVTHCTFYIIPSVLILPLANLGIGYTKGSSDIVEHHPGFGYKKA
jgi:hypothetical protein